MRRRHSPERAQHQAVTSGSASSGSLWASADRASLAELSRQLIAAVPETDPQKVAALLADAVDGFLSSTEAMAADRPTPWHCGLALDVADLTATLVSEALLHGYDIAAALRVPWPIDPQAALLALGAAAPLLGMLVDSTAAAGHCATYRIALRAGPTLHLRFRDGAVALASAEDPVDCEISADPVAFLLVLTGRMSIWPAMALGSISSGGVRPELAGGFADLFLYP